MHKLKKNIATAVALAMVISGFAPTAQAYSISNNSNSSIFSRIKSMLGVNLIKISRLKFAKTDGSNLNETELILNSGESVRIKIFGEVTGSLNSVKDSDVKVKFEEINIEGEITNEIKLTPDKITKNKSTINENITNIIADVKVPNNDTTEEKVYKISVSVDGSDIYSYGNDGNLFVKIPGKVSNNIKIDNFYASEGEKTEKTAYYNFIAKGTDLDKSKLSLAIKNQEGLNVTNEIFKINREKENELIGKDGNHRNLKLQFPIDDLDEGQSKKYTISLLSDGKETGKSIEIILKKDTTTQVSLIKSITPKDGYMNYEGGTVKYTLITDETLKAEDILCRVKKDNITSVGDLKVTIKDTVDLTKKEVSIEINKNQTSKDKVYSLEFADRTNNQYNVNATLTHYGNTNLEPTIDDLEPTEIIDVPASGTKEERTIKFNVVASRVDVDKLGIKVTSEDKEINIDEPIIKADGARRKISLVIPENKDSKEKIYKIKFSADKNAPNPVYNEKLILKVTQKAAETPKVMKVIEFNAPKADLPEKGGTISVTARGENLESKKLSLKVEKLLKDGQKEDVTEKVVGSSVFVGEEIITSPNDMTMSASLKFPKVSSKDKIDKYKVTLIVDGKNEFKTINITVSKYGTLADTTDFGLAGVYMDGPDKIILQSEENLYEVIPDSLKENISLKIVTDKKEEKPENSKKESKDGFVKLSDEDKVELKDNFITITLKNPIDIEKLDVTQSKVRIEKRVLKNSKGLPFGELEHIINKDVPVVHEYEFISGEILDSKGGEVAVKLNGINLVNPGETAEKEGNPKATRVRVFKKENLKGDIKYLDGVKVEGEGKEQTIRFTLPANKGKRTESYTVMISLNNGKTYSPEVGVNMLDSRGTRISPSVLPEGKTASDATLAFASIQSYGTAGGGTEAPDNTHTNTPTNQESKKTFVHLYGTNLRKNTTKVRIIHKETGAVFVPTHEPAKDSGDRFIMVGFDGTGIIGDGNHQQLEIIAPRGYVGDNTWIYQFAIDGVNYDHEITVSATVVDDKEDPGTRPVPAEAIRTLVVKYLTTDGKEVAKQEEHKVFKGQQFYSSDIAPKEIKGYKYLGVKEVKEAKARLEELNNKTSLTEAEKAEKAKLENLFNNVVNQKFKELEMTYTNKPGTEGVLTFLYEDTTPSKPEKPEEKPEIPSVPSVPEKPQEEEKPEEKPGEGVKVEVVDKIAGETRYDTSLDISKKVYSTSEKVYLVSGEKFPDALSSAALAGKGDGPILLINDKNVDKILSEINRLGAKEIVFVGGNSISKANEDKIKKFAESKSSVVSAFAGENRYETAIKVAEETIAKRGNKGKVIIADGRNYPDAVSIAPYASKEGIPVILVNGNKVPSEVKAFLNKYKIKDAIFVGGTKAVGKDVEKLFKKVDRVAGADRYETSKKIADKFFAGSSTVFMASGESFADSLSVSYYAGMQTAPVLLTKANSLDNDTRDYLNANKDKNYIIIGGDKAVNPNLFK